MNDVTVVTSVTYPSPESLALVADVQYHEPYLSAALNRKFRGIVDPGFYAGFLPKPGGGMNLLITSVDGDKTAGAASVDIGEFYQVTIQHRKDISLALNAGKKYAIVLKGRYLLGEDTYQVNTASHIHAAEFVARTYTDSYQLGDGELLVCTVNIPAGVSTITQEMIDTSERINRTIGIDISDSVTSTRSDVAASSLAVKKAYDLAKSKYTAQDASTTQKGLVQLSSATDSTSEVLAATPKAVKAAYDLANGKYTAQDATTAQKGIVQLSSDTNSTSETLAATPKAVKAAYDLAAGKAPSSHTHPWNQITGVPTASLTAKGITQLSSATDSTSEVLAATPKAVKAAYDLANGKYTAQDATTAQKGIVQLSSATNSTSEVLAATPKAVKAAYDLANGKQAADATLTALAALATAADKLPYFTGVDRAALTALTSVGRAILGKTSTQGVLDYLGLGETINLAAGAVQKTGDEMNGKLTLPQTSSFGVNTNNTLGGSSIAIGDNDTGLKGNGDGNLAFMANNVLAGYFNENELQHSKKMLTKNFQALVDNNWPEGAGGFSGQLSSEAPFSVPMVHRQNNDNNFFPLLKGKVSLESGYPVAASFGILTSGNTNFPQIAIHAKTDFDVNDKIWVFDVATGEFRAPGRITATEILLSGKSRVAPDGNLYGDVWGGWLNDFLNNNYNRKNTASLGDYGWVRDESTGFIMQWGTLGSSNGTYNFPREFPASCFAVFVTNNNQQGGAVDNAFGYPVSKSQFFAATKDSSSSNHINNYPVAWFAIGR
ncbi:tail fiber protein [Salmonella enterica subsp. enterica serovar Mbandaka]|nr:tail fiber protein [Salmonella enterica]MBJ2950672.1 tail fiber protein [Salmonella enterica subsp. enterica serovar Mbandaka]